MVKYDKLAPLYAQVKYKLMERISSGDLSEGNFLPPEHDLCAQMGVSRITLRRAVKELSDEGVLIRQQGRGTAIAPKKIQQTLVSLSGFTDAFEKDGHQVDHEILSTDHDQSDSGAQAALVTAGHGQLARFRRLILVDERPFTLETLFLDQERMMHVLQAVSAGASFFKALRDHNGPVPATTERLINVGFATSVEQDQLRIGPSQPVYRIEKTVHDTAGVPIAFSRLVTPTNLITYALRC